METYWELKEEEEMYSTCTVWGSATPYRVKYMWFFNYELQVFQHAKLIQTMFVIMTSDNNT